LADAFAGLAGAAARLPDAAGLAGVTALRRDALRAGATRAGFFFDPERRDVDLAMKSQLEERPAPDDHCGGCRRKHADRTTRAVGVSA
jgi:hypothetical protein